MTPDPNASPAVWARSMSATEMRAQLSRLAQDPHLLDRAERVALLDETARRIDDLEFAEMPKRAVRHEMVLAAELPARDEWGKARWVIGTSVEAVEASVRLLNGNGQSGS